MSSSPEQRKANLRLGLILASVALAFLAGFIIKMSWLV
ncbi:cytochrome oxidase small assembly protein [Comamonas composti]|nr:cytochrome oxidase small assembly protein [Comamonas composti]